MGENKMFDIAAYKNEAQDVATVTIMHPGTGEPTSIKITVASMDSEKYKQISMKVQNEQLKYAMKNRGKTTAERIASNSLEILVGATVAWEGLAEGDKPLPCTPENVRRVYTDLPFIKEQVDEFLGDRRNFIRS